MFNKLLNFIVKRQLASHQEEIKRLKLKVNDLVDNIGDPRHVINKTLKRDLSWYDYEELPREQREVYVNTAKSVLQNPSFNNEINHAIADLTAHIAKEAKNFEEVMYARHTINGIQLILDRINDMSVEPKKENKNPYSSI